MSKLTWGSDGSAEGVRGWCNSEKEIKEGFMEEEALEQDFADVLDSRSEEEGKWCPTQLSGQVPKD